MYLFSLLESLSREERIDEALGLSFWETRFEMRLQALKRYQLGMRLIEKWAKEGCSCNQLKIVAQYCMAPPVAEIDLINWLEKELARD